jgi:hypothetical protein
MKYDQTKLPLGSRERVVAQLEKVDLIKALKTCRSGNISLTSVSLELDRCLQKLYESGNAGTILSGYYFSGVFGKYTAEELLSLMYEKKDIPGFLRQIYRFGIYKGFEEQIEQGIQWHEVRNLPDARAWRLKFQKIFEQAQVAKQFVNEPIEILQEEQSVTSNNDVYIKLTPIVVTASQRARTELSDATNEDPYIISQVSRSKMERANRQHATTLAILTRSLRQIGCEVRETKLIDTFSVVKNQPIIFEVKSINEDNERDQVRHAISQLYEYRFLYSLNEALLCLVFSQKPFSQWLIDYLIKDRSIYVLWIEQDQLAGLSLKEITG